MIIEILSDRQLEVFDYVLDENSQLIADGSVRSGKTISMCLAYVIWAMEYFDQANFIIAGKTVTSTERNIIMPLQMIERIPYKMDYHRSDRVLTVTCGEKKNYFYVFGGKDESSYALIQGLTAAGALFDEVALMPRSFVDQSIARTLTFKNAKLWFNCNPESPNHWFYQEFIKGEKPNTKYLHFQMSDNPIMGEAEIAKAAAMFTGVFYQRYILGQWVRAEGVIFRQFADNPENWIIDELSKEQLDRLQFISFGVDYGENVSNTVFTAAGIERRGKAVYTLAERRLESKGISPDLIEREFVSFVQNVSKLYPGIRLTYAFCDHPETITNGIDIALRKAGLSVRAVTVKKEEITTRIYAREKMLNLGLYKVLRRCPLLIHSLKNQVWDEDKEDVRLDNDPEIADIGDADEYSWQAFIDEIGVR